MNSLLFENYSDSFILEPTDRRAVHIRKNLGKQENQCIKAGILNGPLGEFQIQKIYPDGTIEGTFHATANSESLLPLSLMVGLVRPPVSERLIRDFASIGFKSISFVATTLAEKSYAQSHIWQQENIKKLLFLGAEQAQTTSLPEIHQVDSLPRLLESAMHPIILLDKSGSKSLFSLEQIQLHTSLLMGPERGFTNEEIRLYRSNPHIQIFHLGPRILRTENACLMGASILIDRLNRP